MRVRHYAQGKFYTIQCPEGTRVLRNSAFRASGKPDPCDGIVVPYNGRKVPIPADPPELLPMLAETGNFEVTLDGEPEPEMRLDGVSCPGCGEDDVNWLVIEDGSEWVHCDRCRDEFVLPVSARPHFPLARRAGD